ncbi:MAG: hypothetical protein EOM11_09830, partial [Erysipelotrichia bacterium]|nr:hypothetical protein [Erysipelotrichia bacterium]
MKVENIKSPADIKDMNIEQLNELCEEIRHFLITSIAKTGGHLSSNLGIVETSVALHYVFHSPLDKIFFDVGHQAYVHKILTGRAKDFVTLRQYNGMSGFQKRCESIHDVWEAGHSSTSLSAALGFAIARDLNNEHYNVVPVIGDGAMASGMSFEALNQIGSEKRNMVIIFNDNDMSISGNVGALSNACTHLRANKGYISFKKDLSSKLSTSKLGDRVLSAMKDMKDNIKHTVVDASIFSELGLDYIGPVNGHDLQDVINEIVALKTQKEWNSIQKAWATDFSEKNRRETFPSDRVPKITWTIKEDNSVEVFASTGFSSTRTNPVLSAEVKFGYIWNSGGYD